MRRCGTHVISQIAHRTEVKLRAHWRSCLEFALPHHSPEAHAAVNQSMAGYFTRLQALPEAARDDVILDVMRGLFAELDAMSVRFGDGLLETYERELPVTPINCAAEAAGLDLNAFEHRDPTLGIRNF